YRDRLDPVPTDVALAADLDELVVVDTADRTRLGALAARVDDAPLVVYDHHPPPTGGGALPAGRGLVEPVGATVTLLIRELRRRGDALPPDLASLALLGLHQDTGDFAFDLTTPEDHDAAAWLHRAGGTLDLVRRYGQPSDRGDARTAFRRAAHDVAEVRDVAGRPVVVAPLDWPTYLPDVAGVAGELLSDRHADAAVLVPRMEDRTLVIARAAGDTFDVGAALRDVGVGGGHPGAAFGRSDRAPADVVAALLPALARHARPARRARDVMSAPVRTVTPTTTVHDASRQLLRYGHGGLPVVEAGTLVGVLSRRDLDRALEHGLGRSEVRGFMGRPPVTAAPDDPLADLEARVAQRGVGRLPVVEDGALVGIVTRSDLLAARHAAPPDVATDDGPPVRVTDRVAARAEAHAGAALATLEAALPTGAALYLVGGTVRDAWLGSRLADLDLLVEGASAADLVDALAAEVGGRRARHAAFGTASLTLPSGLQVDVATAREERYAHPGALPDVEPSDVRRDLARRDFTLNALAMRWAPRPHVWWDPYGGADDLRTGTLRTLHPLSFTEDPTRIVRGARLAGRLGFAFAADADAQARDALAEGRGATVSADRLRAELLATLREERPARALRVLADLGALAALYGLPHPADAVAALDALRSEGRDVPAAAYLVTLLAAQPDADARAFVARFHVPTRRADAAAAVRRIRSGAADPDDAPLEAMGRPGRAVLEAVGGDLATAVRTFESLAGRRRLRGRDLLELGVAPGPEVGRILGAVAAARRRREVRTFEEERALAERWVADATPDGDPNPGSDDDAFAGGPPPGDERRTDPT
ncbi:MAG: CBS domain-containing protein, partial [Trueperaceae bacterium]|nr:CBS domain-containing protein [Trueperaceae bacterium]